MTIEEIKELIKAVSDSEITTFEYEDDNQTIQLKKDTVKQEIIHANPVTMTSLPVVDAVATDRPAAQETKAEDAGLKIVKSPLVGTFYSSASPGAEPFVRVGDIVQKGQILGIIEAMKLMNDIESDFDGEIVEIMVNNKDMVEYDQPLFKIK